MQAGRSKKGDAPFFKPVEYGFFIPVRLLMCDDPKEPTIRIAYFRPQSNRFVNTNRKAIFDQAIPDRKTVFGGYKLLR